MNLFQKIWSSLFKKKEGYGLYEVRFEYTNDNTHGDINPHAERVFQQYANNPDEAREKVLTSWFKSHKEEIRNVRVIKL